MDTGPDSSRANRDITAVITNYNYGRFLPEAVDSVLRQGASAVVVDDGSTEPVPDLPADVELIRQDNQGVATARNTGLARVQSPYVIVLDADDRLAPGALEALRRPLDADPQLGFAYGRMRFFGDWAGELRFPPYGRAACSIGTRSGSRRSFVVRCSRRQEGSTPSSSSSRIGSTGSTRSPTAGRGCRSTP